MEKRVLIAVVLSFLVLYGYQAMFVPKQVPRPKATQAELATGSSAPGAGQSASSSSSPAQSTLPGQAGSSAVGSAPLTGPGAAQPVVELVSAAAEQDVVVETDLVRGVFTNRGAALKSWRLKRYKDKAGRPVDMVPQALAGAAKPFFLATGNEAVDARANGALYRVDGGGAARDPKTGVYVIAFEYRESNGIGVRKTFAIDAAKFTINVTVDASVGGVPANVGIVMGPSPGSAETQEASRYIMGARAILYRDGRVERHDVGALITTPVYEGAIRYAGVDDHYFMSVALLGTTPARVEYRPLTLQDSQGKPTHTFIAYSVNPQGQSVNTTFFIGPKEFDLLKSIDIELVRAIDYGMFAAIVVPLLRALVWLNNYIGNYGWSIIALTFLINLAIFPLRHKSVVSMRKMQMLQPEIKAIQDRYGKMKATDPGRQKMNQELMDLYKSRGVNPASGCVPMLLTMPILFAFYSMLAYSIELRGAPFGLWITDLSVYDPYFVSPILTGITMLVQQRMTPQTATDPVQQKMFMFMPVIFTVMFLWAPSGLNIYWLVNNLLAIGQQYFTNRIIGAPDGPRPPADRRLKKAVGAA
jgi:YidC/Oxa1 family membrane protein insertase